MKKFLKNFIRCVALVMALLGVSLVLTAGVLSDEVKLKNVSEPFIDLDAMVADLDVGQGGIAQTAVEDDGKTDLSAEEAAPETVEVIITVRESEIKINDIVVTGENLPKAFDAIFKPGMQVSLVDDYAEYHTFTDIKDWLEDKKINYTEKAN